MAAERRRAGSLRGYGTHATGGRTESTWRRLSDAVRLVGREIGRIVRNRSAVVKSVLLLRKNQVKYRPGMPWIRRPLRRVFYNGFYEEQPSISGRRRDDN